MKRPHILRGLALAGAAAALTLSACGTSDRDRDIAYTTAPASWGMPGMCYFIYSPLECSLYGPTAGLTAARMPDYWLARYSGYYLHDSAYRDRIPASYRDDWDRDRGTWENRHAPLVKREKAFGSWVDTKTKKKVDGVRPAQIDAKGTPLSASGSTSKKTDLKVNKDSAKKDKSSWGFGSSGKSTSSEKKSSWGFGSSSGGSKSTGSTGRKP